MRVRDKLVLIGDGSNPLPLSLAAIIAPAFSKGERMRGMTPSNCLRVREHDLVRMRETVDSDGTKEDLLAPRPRATVLSVLLPAPSDFMRVDVSALLLLYALAPL